MLIDFDKAEKLLRRLEGPRSHLAIAAVAALLVLPSLSNRLVLDDHVLGLLSRDNPGIRGLRSHPLDLFTFTTGEASANRALIDEGALLPWWSDPRHLNAFFRPLSSFTHRLDFALWPNSALLMHAHSILWFCALLLLVHRLYRSFAPAPGWYPGLAFVLFALDDAHGATVGWIANRNAVIAATFAVLALSAHHRFRSRGWRPGALLGPLWLAVGLLGGESAIAICGYLFAYAIFVDQGRASERLASLAGYVAVGLGWLAVYKLLGIGSYGSGAYHDPFREPGAYIQALLHNLPVLLSSQLGIPAADLAFWGEPRSAAPLLALSVVTLALIFYVAFPFLLRDRLSRFWALAAVLAAAPVAASLPGERLLLMVGLGACPWMAGLLVSLAKALEKPGGGASGALRGAVLILLIALHLVAAPLLLPMRARTMEFLGSAIDRADRGIPMSESIRDKTVVIVNAPFDVMVSYLQVMRESRREPRPRHLYWLATASSPLELSRVAERTLRLKPRAGFIYAPPERHYRGDFGSFAQGQVIRFSEMEARIVEVGGDGRPRAVDFTFAAPLAGGRYLFRRWNRGELVPFNPPPLGKTARFPAEDFFQIVLSNALTN